MKTIDYYDHILSRMLLDWIDNTPWTEAFYALLSYNIIAIAPDSFGVDKPAFTKDAETSNATKESCIAILKSFITTELENKAIAELKLHFNLDGVDAKIIDFFYLYQTNNSLGLFYGSSPDWEMVARLGRFVGASDTDVLNRLQHRGKLALCGIAISEGHVLRIPRWGIAFGLSGQVIAYLGNGGDQPLISFLLELDDHPVLRLDSFDIPEITKRSALASLSTTKAKPYLLLYGKPGTGKMEFSRALCAELGYKAYFIKHDRGNGDRP